MKWLLTFIISLNICLLQSQNTTITGKVTDKRTGEALFGVNIVLQDNTGCTTNEKGIYETEIKPGRQTLNFYYIGYKNESRTVFVRPGESLEINVLLTQETQLLEEIVVSAGKHEQKLSEVIVSMEVIKAEMIENSNTTDMDHAINKVPGVDIMDDQPSIRGGSGYSYGAGSRVLVMVDDLPILSADAGDAKWSFLPVENVSQIEILKGASSVLYGSSALNGVINLRTAYPGSEPKTKVSVFNGFYMNPIRKELIWWGVNQPLFAGANFFHSKQINNLDLVVGGQLYSTDGYRQFESEERARVNMNLRYRCKKIKGLSYGLNTNLMYLDKNDFFIWLDGDSGVYRQDPDAYVHTRGTRFNTDPYVEYFTQKGNKHSLKTRYFLVDNKLPEDTLKNSVSEMYHLDYQYQKKIYDKHILTMGYTTSYGDIQSYLFGNHYSTNIALYSQIDWKLKKLNISAGVRGEYFKIDREESKSVIDGDTIQNWPIQPVFRLGANYQLAEFTFLRASYGQGYRFPSIAEKYIATNLSSLRLFPNPDLKAETGWSAEIGIKQGFKVSGWNGYLDVAGFWQEYREMMEFTFGFYDPATYRRLDTSNPADSAYITDKIIDGTYGIGDFMGFQSINIGRAKITGVDITLTGIGTLFGLPATLLCGYTYTNPIDLVGDTLKSSEKAVLKYRFFHSAKGDLELEPGKFSIGLSLLYRSFMINIDKAFEEPLIDGSPDTQILPGIKEYREKFNKGYVLFDIRAGYSLTEYSKLSFIVKNIFNKEWMGRPGDVGPPRNVSLQYTFNF